MCIRDSGYCEEYHDCIPNEMNFEGEIYVSSVMLKKIFLTIDIPQIFKKRDISNKDSQIIFIKEKMIKNHIL